tara:strand:- start:91 stop:279 length:189 start_codon:yes stop_codon:yes gene_type:complete
MNKDCGIICLYKVVKKNEPNSVILIEQGEAGKSIVMFEDPIVKPLIESAGHIYDATVILSYF